LWDGHAGERIAVVIAEELASETCEPSVVEA
jgi:hypothetical protein